MKGFLISAFFLMTTSVAGIAQANAAIGQAAPDFSVADTKGATQKLSDHKGKYVVLEWVNPGCPFVRKHYNGNMQDTQKDATSHGAVWYTLNSTAQGQSDYKSPADMAAWMQSQQANATATLMDTDGKIGNAYGAKTTPHLYIIDPKGVLIYAGAIDSKPTSRVEDIKDATNYVKQALKEARAGKPVSIPSTQAYGCSVKY